jgi:hypothetical protein
LTGLTITGMTVGRTTIQTPTTIPIFAHGYIRIYIRIYTINIHYKILIIS